MSKTFWSGPVTTETFNGTLSSTQVSASEYGWLPVFPSDAFSLSYDGVDLVNQTTNSTTYDFSVSHHANGSRVDFHSSFSSNLNTSKILIVNTTEVKCAIYNGDNTNIENYKTAENDPSNISNPLTAAQKLNYLYFHSDLNYLGNTDSSTTLIYHPARAATPAVSSGKYSGVTYNLSSGEQEWTLLNHSGTIDSPFIIKINNNQIPSGYPVQMNGASVRSVSAYNDGTSIKLREKWMTVKDSLSAAFQTYTVYVFKILGNNTTTSLNKLQATATSFTAGAGRLNTDYKYLRRASGTPDFYFIKGKTADTERGYMKVIAPNGYVAYNPSGTGLSWSHRHNSQNIQSGVTPLYGSTNTFLTGRSYGARVGGTSNTSYVYGTPTNPAYSGLGAGYYNRYGPAFVVGSTRQLWAYEFYIGSGNTIEDRNIMWNPPETQGYFYNQAGFWAGQYNTGNDTVNKNWPLYGGDFGGVTAWVIPFGSPSQGFPAIATAADSDEFTTIPNWDTLGNSIGMVI